MPELPDVALYHRLLDAHGLGREIAEVRVSEPRILAGIDAGGLAARLVGGRLAASRRHGKHLLARIDRGGWLTVHFGMSGRLAAYDDPADAPAHERVRLRFAAGGSLGYVNVRLLGRVGWTEDADAFIAEEGLGPDALDPRFDAGALAAALAASRRDVKTVLMDQSVIAGIGNVYADEILFQARIHPRRPARRVAGGEAERLYGALWTVLETAIRCGAGAEAFLDRLPAGFLLPERHSGGHCPRCGTALAVVKIGGRTSYFCPRCQDGAG